MSRRGYSWLLTKYERPDGCEGEGPVTPRAGPRPASKSARLWTSSSNLRLLCRRTSTTAMMASAVATAPTEMPIATPAPADMPLERAELVEVASAADCAASAAWDFVGVVDEVALPWDVVAPSDVALAGDDSVLDEDVVADTDELERVDEDVGKASVAWHEDKQRFARRGCSSSSLSTHGSLAARRVDIVPRR